MEQLAIHDTPIATWIERLTGLILFTGLTGSGKCTTRAACVKALLPRGLNILTVEDPTEYIFSYGVTHLKIDKMTRAEAMRAVMWHDPDVVVVGELDFDDPEVSRMAVQMADTGHLVMPVIHAKDAISPLYGFLDCGVKRSLLAANLVGSVNQRLLPKLCQECAIPQEPDPELLAEIRKAAAEGGYEIPDSAVFYGPVGCDACKGGGYAGRVALHEYFTFTPALRAAFVRGATLDELTQLARQDGQLSSFAAGVKRVVEDRIMSLEYVMRTVPRWRV